MASSLKDIFAHFDPLETLTSHLKARLGKVPDCPLCKSRSWNLAGPSSQALARYDLTKAGRIEPIESAFPLISLVCSNCAYTMQFAWTHVLAHRRDDAKKS